MTSYCTDPRGVSRGKCTLCPCLSYTRSGPEGIKCAECNHPPAKHLNISHLTGAASPGAAAFAGVAHGSIATPFQCHHPSSVQGSGYEGSTTSGYTPPSQVPPSVNLPRCPATGCYKKVHYDDVLGPFDYCSPECRDRHLLPMEQRKLKEDIANFSKTIATLPALVSTQPSKISSRDIVKGLCKNEVVISYTVW